MSDPLSNNSDTTEDDWVTLFQDKVRHFPYPPTPDFTRRVIAKMARPEISRWRLAAQAALIAILIFSGLMAVPEIRAGILEFLRVGVVEIFVDTAPPTDTLLPTVLPSILDLPGRVTLEEAQGLVSFQIRLPAEIPAPDRVFVPEFPWRGEASEGVVLAWMNNSRRDQVEIILYEFKNVAEEIVFSKFIDRNLSNAEVNGNRAVWAQGPHMLYMLYDDRSYPEIRRIIDKDVLIWTDEEITYRLETNLEQEDAVELAESIH